MYMYNRIKRSRKYVRSSRSKALAILVCVCLLFGYVTVKSFGPKTVSRRRRRLNKVNEQNRTIFTTSNISSGKIPAFVDSKKLLKNQCSPTEDGDICCIHHHNSCTLAKKNCPIGTRGSRLINYFEIFYCGFEKVPILGYIVLCIWLMTILSLLATTADNFFVPLLESMSSTLRLSPSTAGITILAFGNCSPDIFSDIALVQTSNFAVALGELLGATMFLTTVVLGAVILISTRQTNPPLPPPISFHLPNTNYNMRPTSLNSENVTKDPTEDPLINFEEDQVQPDVEVDKNPFIRDICVFLFALVILFIFCWTDNSLSVVESMIIVGCYIVYVTGVVVSSRFSFSQELSEENALDESFHIETDVVQRVDVNAIISDRFLDFNTRSAARRSARALTHTSETLHSALESPTKRTFTLSVSSNDSRDEIEFAMDNLDGLNWEKDMSLVGKIFWILEFPFSLLRWLSISPADGRWDHRRRKFCAFSPIGSVCIIFLCFSDQWTGSDSPWDGFTQLISIGGLQIPLVLFPLFLASFVGFLMYRFSKDEEIPEWHLALMVIAFFTTVAWLDMIGNECVAVLEVLGTVTGTSKTKSGRSLIGITILAWANSIGDFVADTSVARAGQPKMGIASTFGSPLLTLCLGIGSSSLLGSMLDGSVPTDMNETIYASFSVLSSLFVAFYFEFKLPRKFAYVLFLLYFCYIVVVVNVKLIEA